ncbi:hypothetical protein [Geomesophilobacter sediminis]|uniref:Uncharacterized protein n=1 Tax=Geomesophilobacter sediminis TaxID=2798584 RepID=A0A8J7M2H2_9BACT|nr:hypothetical protein [Geomesophilobacter sediminis]MBJ6727408.1 hypothetical protein [Geomesophilobacter sediminis]
MPAWFLASIILLFAAALISACGGGGSGSGSSTIAVKLATVAQPGQTPQAKGITVTLLLPQGVTLRTVTGTRQTAPGVFRFSGAAPFANVTSQLFPRPLFGTYSAGSPGRNAVTLAFTSPVAFGAGEFATLSCEVPAGVTAPAASFQILDFHASGDSATQFADDITAQFQAPTVTLVP